MLPPCLSTSIEGWLVAPWQLVSVSFIVVHLALAVRILLSSVRPLGSQLQRTMLKKKYRYFCRVWWCVIENGECLHHCAVSPFHRVWWYFRPVSKHLSQPWFCGEKKKKKNQIPVTGRPRNKCPFERLLLPVLRRLCYWWLLCRESVFLYVAGKSMMMMMIAMSWGALCGNVL